MQADALEEVGAIGVRVELMAPTGRTVDDADVLGAGFALLGLGSPAGSTILALPLVQAIFDGGRLYNQPR